MRPRRNPADFVPDVRDGLTRAERVILVALDTLQRERPGRGVNTVALYAEVLESVDLSQEELQALLNRLVGRGSPP